MDVSDGTRVPAFGARRSDERALAGIVAGRVAGYDFLKRDPVGSTSSDGDRHLRLERDQRPIRRKSATSN